MVRGLPSQLLCGFKGEGLGTLSIVWPDVDIDKGPVILTRHLAAQPVDIVIVSLDSHDGRCIDQAAQYLACLKVSGDKDVAAEPRLCRVRGHRVCKISCRGAGHRCKSQFHGPRNGNRDHPVFKRKRRMVDRIILDIQLFKAKLCPEIPGLDERGKTCIQPHCWRAFYREEVCITPETLRAILNPFTADMPPDLVVVIIYLQGAETEFTHVKGNRGI